MCSFGSIPSSAGAYKAGKLKYLAGVETGATLRADELLPSAQDVVNLALPNELGGGTPEQFAAHIKAESERWSKLVKTAGITPD